MSQTRAQARRAAAALTLTLALTGQAGDARAEPAPASQASQATPATQLCLPALAQAQAGIRLETLRPAAVDAALSTVGQVTYADPLVNHVASPVRGRVRAILVQPGQQVRQGQALAEIDSPDMGQARADVHKARAGLRATQLDLKRQTSLYAAGACSARDVEMARDAYRRARAEQARADKKWALLGGTEGEAKDPGDLGHRGSQGGQIYVLRAPQDGQVLERAVRLGDEVQGQFDAGSSGDLFVLANLDTVWVTAEVYESDLGRLRPGAEAYILQDSGDQQAAMAATQGQLEWIGEVLDANVRTVKVRCSYRNVDRQLRPNTFVSLLIAAPARDALTVPKDGLLRISDQTFVFVATPQPGAGDATCFRLRPVEVDQDSDARLLRVPVFHGLRQGETVVGQGAAPLLSKLLQQLPEAP